MPARRKFDRDAVLGRAMKLFWRRGYEATSLDDLVEAMGINRASLYATFGSKQKLFLAAFERYLCEIGAPIMAPLNDPDPRRGIRLMLEAILSRCVDLRYPRGCFQTNTALECPGVCDEIARAVADSTSAMESAIYDTLRRAQAVGFLDPHEDARRLARFYLGVAQGMNVVNKATGNAAMLQDMIEASMSAWPEAADKKPRGKSQLIGRGARR
ncbi:MAG: TetR/AcrR family transcriptional regulator [Deltaproteobacteria bacterium]|nr:TetR/AcrR family transcriptional regulator [Deltaproteobacteria bacterium]